MKAFVLLSLGFCALFALAGAAQEYRINVYDGTGGVAEYPPTPVNDRAPLPTTSTPKPAPKPELTCEDAHRQMRELLDEQVRYPVDTVGSLRCPAYHFTLESPKELVIRKVAAKKEEPPTPFARVTGLESAECLEGTLAIVAKTFAAHDKNLTVSDWPNEAKQAEPAKDDKSEGSLYLITEGGKVLRMQQGDGGFLKIGTGPSTSEPKFFKVWAKKGKLLHNPLQLLPSGKPRGTTNDRIPVAASCPRFQLQPSAEAGKVEIWTTTFTGHAELLAVVGGLREAACHENSLAFLGGPATLHAREGWHLLPNSNADLQEVGAAGESFYLIVKTDSGHNLLLRKLKDGRFSGLSKVTDGQASYFRVKTYSGEEDRNNFDLVISADGASLKPARPAAAQLSKEQESLYLSLQEAGLLSSKPTDRKIAPVLVPVKQKISSYERARLLFEASADAADAAEFDVMVTRYFDKIWILSGFCFIDGHPNHAASAFLDVMRANRDGANAFLPYYYANWDTEGDAKEALQRDKCALFVRDPTHAYSLHNAAKTHLADLRPITWKAPKGFEADKFSLFAYSVNPTQGFRFRRHDKLIVMDVYGNGKDRRYCVFFPRLTGN